MRQYNGKHTSAPRRTVHNVGRLCHRLVTLLELQSALLKLDLKDGLNNAKISLGLLAGGAVVGLGSVPVLLLAVAHAFREGAGFSWTAAYACAALLGLAVAAAGFFAGWKTLRRGLAVFDRSKSEFQTNLVQLKLALKDLDTEGASHEAFH